MHHIQCDGWHVVAIVTDTVPCVVTPHLGCADTGVLSQGRTISPSVRVSFAFGPSQSILLTYAKSFRAESPTRSDRYHRCGFERNAIVGEPENDWQLAIARSSSHV